MGRCSFPLVLTSSTVDHSFSGPYSLEPGYRRQQYLPFRRIVAFGRMKGYFPLRIPLRIPLRSYDFVSVFATDASSTPSGILPKVVRGLASQKRFRSDHVVPWIAEGAVETATAAHQIMAQQGNANAVCNQRMCLSRWRNVAVARRRGSRRYVIDSRCFIVSLRSLISFILVQRWM